MEFRTSQDSTRGNDLGPYGPPPPYAYVPVDPFKPSIAFSLKNVFRRGRSENAASLENLADVPSPFRILKTSTRPAPFPIIKPKYRHARLGDATLEAVTGVNYDEHDDAYHSPSRSPTPPPTRPTPLDRVAAWRTAASASGPRRTRPGVVFDIDIPHQPPPPVSVPSHQPSASLDTGYVDNLPRGSYREGSKWSPKRSRRSRSPDGDSGRGKGIQEMLRDLERQQEQLHDSRVETLPTGITKPPVLTGDGPRTSWYRPSRRPEPGPAVATGGGDEEDGMPPLVLTLVDRNPQPRASRSRSRGRSDRSPRPDPGMPSSARGSCLSSHSPPPSQRSLPSNETQSMDLAVELSTALDHPESWAVDGLGSASNASVEYSSSPVSALPSLSPASRSPRRSPSPTLLLVPAEAEQTIPVGNGLHYSRYDALVLSSLESLSPVRTPDISSMRPASTRPHAHHVRPLERPSEIMNTNTIALNAITLKPGKPTDDLPTMQAYILAFLIDTLPRQLYLYLLLHLPYLYFSRVTRIFEEAELSMPMIRQGILDAARAKMAAGYDAGMTMGMKDGKRGGMGGMGMGRSHPGLPFDLEPPAESMAYANLQNTWQSFIDSLLREWKTLNIISVLLLSAILTILQIESAASDPLTRFSALLSMVCALMSLLYGCIYIIRFGTMRKTYKGAEWAQEAQKSRTGIFWNVWVLLAMPATWLAWSMILYIITIMAFVWRTSPFPSSLSSTLGPIPTSSSAQILVPRIIITLVLSLGLVYFVLIAATLRRYGEMMDRAWQRRIWGWMRDGVAVVSRGREKESEKEKDSDWDEKPTSNSFYPEKGTEKTKTRDRGGLPDAGAGADADEKKSRPTWYRSTKKNRRRHGGGNTVTDAIKKYQAETGLVSGTSRAQEEKGQASGSSGDDEDNVAVPGGDTDPTLSMGFDVTKIDIGANELPQDDADANDRALDRPAMSRSPDSEPSSLPPELSASPASASAPIWSNSLTIPNPNPAPTFCLKAPSDESKLFMRRRSGWRPIGSRDIVSRLSRPQGVDGVAEEIDRGGSTDDDKASFAADASSMPVDAALIDLSWAEGAEEQNERLKSKWKGKAKSLSSNLARLNSQPSPEDGNDLKSKEDLLLNLPADLPADIIPFGEGVPRASSKRKREKNKARGQRLMSQPSLRPPENEVFLPPWTTSQATGGIVEPTVMPATSPIPPIPSEESIQPPMIRSNSPVLRFDQGTAELNAFSNNSPYRLIYQNQLYPTAMHLFEAMKFIEHRPDIAVLIRNCADVEDVYALAIKFQEFQRPDWTDRHLDVLDEVLFLKFKQHPDLRSRLLGTHDAKRIIYAEPDDYWGIGQNGKGRNILGEALVRIRERLLAESL